VSPYKLKDNNFSFLVSYKYLAVLGELMIFARGHSLYFVA